MRRRIGRSLHGTIAIAMATLVVVLMGASMALVRSRVGDALRSGIEARGASIAQSIGAVSTPSLLAYNYAALQIAAEGAARDPALAYVVIHDKEGNVAGAAGPAPPQPVFALRSSLRGAAHASGDVVIGEGQGDQSRVLEVAAPVRVDGTARTWGVVRVGMRYETVERDLRALTIQLVWLGALLTLTAVALGLWLAGRITAPLRELVKGTEALSAGDMSHRIPVEGAEEIADLARSFNVTMDRLQAKAGEVADFQTALEVLNATLELQVQERTRALEESNAQYKSLVDHSPDSILIVQGGAVRFVNRGFTETFGIPAEEATAAGFRLSTIFEPSSCLIATDQIDAWERGESPAPTEILGRDASGRIRHLELRGSRIDYQGRPAAECLLVDMTESRRLRERLSETERLRALGELAGGVAHDFNNLLGAVLGRIQLLRRRGFPSDIDYEMEIIEKAAQDGRETVRRIQEFSRTRRDKRFAAVDLAEVLHDALEITKTRWKNDAMRRKAAIEALLEMRPVAPILGNAAELREVFTNLILNAVDAMPQGGALRLACFDAGERVVAQVTDTGLGMTESTRKHLFDPFYSTKGTRGMGLGLSVAYGIVTRHEGRIDVTSEPGRGTTFRLEFPRMQAIPRPLGGDGAALPNLIRPGRILVIDDEPEIGEVIREILIAEGHQVDLAQSGAEGVEWATTRPYDLVFTDLGMPGMSGWDVAEVLRTTHPDLAVALVTGWGATLDENQAQARGIAAIVNKPFDIQEIVRVTAGLLARTTQTP